MLIDMQKIKNEKDCVLKFSPAVLLYSNIKELQLQLIKNNVFITFDENIKDGDYIKTNLKDYIAKFKHIRVD